MEKDETVRVTQSQPTMSRFLDHNLIDFVRLVLEDFDGFLDPQLKLSFAWLNQILQ